MLMYHAIFRHIQTQTYKEREMEIVPDFNSMHIDAYLT